VLGTGTSRFRLWCGFSIVLPPWYVNCSVRRQEQGFR
jgi:hypothetical protein